MVKSSKGPRARTRKLLRKNPRIPGMPTLSRIFQQFSPGDKACIIIDPRVHKGQPFRRFHGLTGTVVGAQGGCLKVEVKVGGKRKTLIVRREHLRKQRFQGP